MVDVCWIVTVVDELDVELPVVEVPPIVEVPAIVEVEVEGPAIVEVEVGVPAVGELVVVERVGGDCVTDVEGAGSVEGPVEVVVDGPGSTTVGPRGSLGSRGGSASRGGSGDSGSADSGTATAEPLGAGWTGRSEPTNTVGASAGSPTDIPWAGATRSSSSSFQPGPRARLASVG